MSKFVLCTIFVVTFLVSISGSGQEKVRLRGPEDVDFSIYPNPFREHITLSVQSGNVLIKSMRITNLIGKDIFEIDLQGKSGSFSQKIEFDSLEPGIYFFTLYSSKGAVETPKSG